MLNKESTPTRYEELDNVFGGGLSAESLYIIGSRPRMGKTAFALNIVANVLSSDQFTGRIVFISTKDNKEVHLQKLTAILTSIPLIDIQKDNLTDIQINQIKQNPYVSKLSQNCLEIIQLTCPEIEEIPTLLNQLSNNRTDCQLLIVDHLQDFINVDDPNDVADKYLHSLNFLKKLAIDAELPIIICSDVNVAVEEREGSNMPLLRDLKGSLEIAKLADVVLFLLRPEYYDISNNVEFPTAIINIAKNKFGPVSNVMLQTNLCCQQFMNEDKFYEI
jgi:replicative DNA helicase